MGKKRELVPVEQLDLSTVKYEPEVLQAPHLTGLTFKLFVNMLESPIVGPFIVSQIRKQNKIDELLRATVVPEAPMYRPEYPPQVQEPGVIVVDEVWKPEDRVEAVLKCLPHYDPASSFDEGLSSSFKYWKIRDYAHAYRSQLTTPSMVAENIISIIEQLKKEKPQAPLLITFDADLVRKQAAASTERFEKGQPISLLDGIFMAIKDDIDCYPHPTKGATTWKGETRHVKKDAVCVARLRSCGVIMLGKANMHELGMGTTGNNPNYGTTRNPHGVERYTGGSSSGPAALVASGLCSATIGTDGGGSVRIPSSLCGIVGMKTTFARTDMEGSLPENSGTVTIIGPLASSVEDVMLIYSAMLGSSPEDRIAMKPSPPCLPNLSSHESMNIISSMRLGKYSAWFNDVHTTEVSDRCEDILNLLTKRHGCEMVEIVIPDLEEMRLAHLVSIGSEMLGALYPDITEGKGKRLTYDIRTSNVLFGSFTAADYLTAQRLRRRIMHHHMEIFKKVDVIVTPTTGMTAPKISPSALKYGETDMSVTGYLMRFVISGNLLGLPAITVPVGYDKEGLPIGLQLIGRPWAEATLLRLAYAVEELCAKPKKKPEEFYDVLKINSNI